jgi:hypothetical protein
MKKGGIQIVPDRARNASPARTSRAGCGVPPQQSSREQSETEKVCDRADAIANTRDECATRKTGLAKQGIIS